MCSSSSSPLQTPVTILDEPRTTSVKSPLRTVENVQRQQPNSPSSYSQPPVSPTPLTVSSLHSTVSTTTAISAIHPKFQPNSSSQNQTATSISTSNSSCLILPAPAASSRRGQSVKSQPLDSGIVDPICFPTKSRQSITRKSLGFRWQRFNDVPLPYKLLLAFQVPPALRLHTTTCSQTQQILIAR